MARPKKEATVAPERDPIPIQEFLRTRDSVVTGLTTLQNSIGDLLRAYMTHCNTIVGGGSSNSLDISNFLNKTSPGPEVKQKRKRARKEKDPNAPKRPLTAYFLYSRQARDIIKQDLRDQNDGQEPKSQEVQDEATKRWNAMEPEEKKRWTDSYNVSYEQYKVKLAAYQAQKALEDADTATGDLDAIAAAEHESDDDDDEEVEEAEAPPPKAPSPPKEPVKTPRVTKGRGKAKANGVVAANAVTSTASPTPVQRRVPLPHESGAAEATPEVAPASVKASGKKKRKDATQEPAKAPAAAPEDEGPKKKKPRKTKASEAAAAEPEAVATPVTVTPGAKKQRKRKSDVAPAA